MGRSEMDNYIARLGEMAEFLKTVRRQCDNYSVLVEDLQDLLTNYDVYQHSDLGKMQGQMQQLSEQLSRLEAGMIVQAVPASGPAAAESGVDRREPYRERQDAQAERRGNAYAASPSQGSPYREQAEERSADQSRGRAAYQSGGTQYGRPYTRGYEEEPGYQAGRRTDDYGGREPYGRPYAGGSGEQDEYQAGRRADDYSGRTPYGRPYGGGPGEGYATQPGRSQDGGDNQGPAATGNEAVRGGYPPDGQGRESLRGRQEDAARYQGRDAGARQETGPGQLPKGGDEALAAVIMQSAGFADQSKDFLEEYKARLYPPAGKKLKVEKSQGERLAKMALEQWYTYQAANNVCLEEGTGEFKYIARELACRAEDGSPCYLVLPVRGPALNKKTVIQNAYIAFFDFDVNRLSDSGLRYEVKEPAIFKQDGSLYQLVKKGRIEFPL